MAKFGPYCLTQEVLNIPGEVLFADNQLVEVRLSQGHSHSKDLLEALPRLW